MNGKIDWTSKLDDFGQEVLAMLGYSDIPSDRNPVTDALSEDADYWVAKFQALNGFSNIGMSRVSVLCQMPLYDAIGGPDEDRKPKGLRRHWYHYYKSRFAQPFARAIGDCDQNGMIDDRRWSQLISITYAEFVDKLDVTYKDLWIKDASRMVEHLHERLFKEANIVLAVEKDSLFEDFIEPARRIGASAVYSGKGKSSKAAIEKLLRERFNWHPRYWDQWEGEWVEETFEENPLVILHISDHDFDGEAIIGPTFAEQARRYTSNILEARVGIKPEQVSNPADDWYIVKKTNNGQIGWAKEKGLWLAECVSCGNQFPVVGIADRWGNPHNCPQCGGDTVQINAKKDTAYGFEVEALKTSQYGRLIVDALLEVLPYDYIIEKLRDECVANSWDAASTARDTLVKDNPDYAALQEEIERLEAIRDKFLDEVESELVEMAEPHINDWRDYPWKEETDYAPAVQNPPTEEFYRHVEDRGYGTWRPFERYERTKKLTEYLLEDDETRDWVVNYEIEW